jgi:hypothetical protein
MDPAYTFMLPIFLQRKVLLKNRHLFTGTGTCTEFMNYQVKYLISTGKYIYSNYLCIPKFTIKSTFVVLNPDPHHWFRGIQPDKKDGRP